MDAPATRSLVETLSRRGVLPDAARADALESLASEATWWHPVLLLVRTLGTTLVLAGVIFFFAANWSGLNRFEKLGLAALLPAFALALALRRGIDGPVGRLSLLAATMLTGAFLAVFGQVYQTGADAWQLFAVWAVLTLPWMLVSRFLGHVLIWLVVLEIAVVTAWTQELHPQVSHFPHGLLLVLAALNASALVVLSALGEKGEDWASRGWARRLLLAATLACLALPTGVLIVEPSRATPSSVASILTPAGIAFSWWWHRRRRADLPSLALTAATGAALVLTFIGKLLFDWSDDWPALLLFGLIVSAVIAGLAVLLRREQRGFGEPS